MYRQWVLTALLAWPVLAAVVVLLAPVRWAKHVALAASLVEFAISVPLWWTFAPADGMQFMLDVSWIPNWGIRYAVGVDGISLFLVLLTTFLVPLSVLGSYSYITTRERGFYALMLVLTAGMLDRKSVVWGKRGDIGGWRMLKKKKKKKEGCGG